ncbi:MAG: hypothetical protein AB1714_30385 [Acidobacteriota bacterium]
MYQAAKRSGLLILLLVIALVGVGCNKNESKNQTVGLVTVMGMLGVGPDGTLGTTLASDVIGVNPDGTTYIIEDSGQATVRNVPLDPDFFDPTPWMDVVLTRYRVTYTRADGRNTPLVDIPLAFEAGMTVSILTDSSTTFSFLLVRAVAKTEPPLIQLAEGIYSEKQILTTATVEFWGADMAGHPVYCKGTIAVHFANWADE